MKPEMRRKLAQLPFEEKIRKVGELIRLRQKIKSDVSEEAAQLASLDKAAALARESPSFAKALRRGRRELTRKDPGGL